MAVLDDSNLAHRGGLAGLAPRPAARAAFLDGGGAARPDGLRQGAGHCRRVRGAAPVARRCGRHALGGLLGHARVRRLMSFALLFSGQGTQHPAMLPWLADDGLVRDMCARLGVDDWRRALADPAWAQRNDNAQTLLTGLALAAWNQLAPQVASPAAVAGYSVGELAAFSAAGVIDARNGRGARSRSARRPWIDVLRRPPVACWPSAALPRPGSNNCALETGLAHRHPQRHRERDPRRPARGVG